MPPPSLLPFLQHQNAGEFTPDHLGKSQYYLSILTPSQNTLIVGRVWEGKKPDSAFGLTKPCKTLSLYVLPVSIFHYSQDCEISLLGKTHM